MEINYYITSDIVSQFFLPFSETFQAIYFLY